MYFSLYYMSIPFLYHEHVHTSLYDGRLVAWANREHLEHSACGPQQFLICEGPHDVDQGLGTTAGQNDQLKTKTDLCLDMLQTATSQVVWVTDVRDFMN